MVSKIVTKNFSRNIMLGLACVLLVALALLEVPCGGDAIAVRRRTRAPASRVNVPNYTNGLTGITITSSLNPDPSVRSILKSAMKNGARGATAAATSHSLRGATRRDA